MITNNYKLPQPFVDAATSEHTYKPKRYSATSLLKGTRQAILERRHNDEIVQDVSEMVWLIFGTAVHKILEESKETDSQLKENYLVIKMPNGYELSGIFDLYDDEEKTVTDYKTASVWKVIYRDFSSWRKQILIYAYMLRRIGFEAENGEVVALLKDHSKTKAKTQADYPQLPIFRKKWRFTDKDFAEVEAWLTEKFVEIEACEQLPDDELPKCSDDERMHAADKWAVMKEGRKTAVKLFDSEEEATKRAEELGAKHYVEHRPGRDANCEDYCSAREFCIYGGKNGR